MGVKKATAKGRRAAPKGKAKGKAKTIRKMPRATATAKPKTKRAAPPAKKRTPRPVAAATPSSVETIPTLPPPVDELTSPEPAKKGPLARLAGGVGSLFARVTGKRAPAPPEPSDQTIEISSKDILAETAAPPPIPKP